jgi:hypothetical protein
MAVEEHQALTFIVEVQQLRIKETEILASNNRIKHNESLSEKTKKHKNEIKRLAKERAEYESKADALINQLNDQMNSLQAMAMDRIGVSIRACNDRLNYL